MIHIAKRDHSANCLDATSAVETGLRPQESWVQGSAPNAHHLPAALHVGQIAADRGWGSVADLLEVLQRDVLLLPQYLTDSLATYFGNHTSPGPRPKTVRRSIENSLNSG